MSLEHDLLTRMFHDDLEMARNLAGIGDYSMAAESLASAIEKLHQIAAINKPHPVQSHLIDLEPIQTDYPDTPK